MGFSSLWLQENWFILLQSAGIIGGLIFTAVSLRQNTKTRRIADLLTLAEHYRELWGRTQSDANLRRISKANVDLLQNPITPAEEEFMDMVIIHFNTSWLMAKEGSLLTLEALTRDVQAFFALPIPKNVWKATRQDRDQAFASFVDRSLVEPQTPPRHKSWKHL